MAGILGLGRRRPRAVSRFLCLPSTAGMGWETVSLPGGTPQPIAEADLGEIADGAVIALPARHVLTLPLWLLSEDPTLYRELVAAQLERRALLRNMEAVWAFLPIARDEGRTLVTAYLVDPDLPAALRQPHAGGYDLSARCRSLPASGLVLWPEQGGIAAAAAREGKPAQILFFPGVSRVDEIASDLLCLRQELDWERIVPLSAPTYLRGGLEGEGVREPLPAPALPAEPIALTPFSVEQQQRERAKREQQKQFLVYGAAVYAAVAVTLAAGLAWMSWQDRTNAAELARNAKTVAGLEETADRWNALQPAIDPTRYPLETLLSATQLLPPEIRLTSFEQSPVHVLLKGEGRDAASAFKFLSAVQADPVLKKWKWTMPQPRILPNNRAQFQMEGSRELASVH